MYKRTKQGDACDLLVMSIDPNRCYNFYNKSRVGTGHAKCRYSYCPHKDKELYFDKNAPKKFSMVHMLDDVTKSKPVEFDETNAPSWLTSETTVPGSTMDMRWFWKDHILTLEIGKSIDTDFRTITRIS